MINISDEMAEKRRNYALVQAKNLWNQLEHFYGSYDQETRAAIAEYFLSEACKLDQEVTKQFLFKGT